MKKQAWRKKEVDWFYVVVGSATLVLWLAIIYLCVNQL